MSHATDGSVRDHIIAELKREQRRRLDAKPTPGTVNITGNLTPLSDTTRAAAEILLAGVVIAQRAFWDAVRRLERVLDVEIDDGTDFAETTVDELRRGK